MAGYNSKWKLKFADNEIPDHFFEWLESVTNDFRKRKDYGPLTEYINQADKWLSDKSLITDYYDNEDKEKFRDREILRIRENSLFFLDKYHTIVDGEMGGMGKIDYKAEDAQKILSFLFDNNLNLLIGKPRQIWFTSTMGGLFIKRVCFFNGYYALYVADEVSKAERIFKEKMRFSFFGLPEWLRATPSNVRDDMLAFIGNPKKGQPGLDSRLEVVSPRTTSATGEAPNLIGMDEIGLNKGFAEMMSEMLPALYKYNPKTKKQERTRQLIAWGTGGKMASGGAEMEMEWKAARKAWKKRNGEYPLIPVMFDVWARPGVDKKFYEDRRKEAYSKEGPEAENFRIKFHQHYPTSEQDMFLQTVKTLIPYDEIVDHINRIYAMPIREQPVYGYFDPVYNTSIPSGPESDTPYKIIGSTFVPTSGLKDPSTTTIMFQKPDPEWEDRYYKGTDPISAETGNSLMSSSIWDDYANTISCVMNWRIRDYKQVFLQSLLMGIHYSPYIKDLVEINNGEFYINYVESKGFENQLVTNLELPKEMQIGSGPTYGINNKGHVPMHIVHSIQSMLGAYSKNIYIVEFFEQLKTFVEKNLPSGRTRYQAKDLKYWRDDIIFSAVYSYICAQCFKNYKPKKIDYDEKNEPTRRFDYDENFNLRLAEFSRDGKRIRFLDHITYDV